MYSVGAPYSAYYDNAYGPIYDGYWAYGSFNFRTGPNAPFQQDADGHFRQTPAAGYEPIQGELHPGAPAAPPAAAPPAEPPEPQVPPQSQPPLL